MKATYLVTLYQGGEHVEVRVLGWDDQDAMGVAERQFGGVAVLAELLLCSY